MEWYLKAIKNYFNFTGRARRTEFWMFAVINFLIGFLLVFIEAVFEPAPIIRSVYYWFILIPSWAVLVRRLHDSGRTGLWILLAFIPYFGYLILFFLACMDSEGNNKYGPSPKY
ncbi:DUF805 domain-containing protein [Paenibacillus sp. FSL R7-0331]|uniref:DUF805 domain-containing protein n=1 Tax=Paenibacillus sp. FSL R7-0331 TaxID=1536773 RepID=UPI0004F6BFF3|nr:DUF805 domain-containing protein [Paenibacillus sp. FSL R7-0331]AIQ54667.1 membrane protein [Paenibacillus sp. FSL R7-0331]